jgi:hypothetical protein
MGLAVLVDAEREALEAPIFGLADGSAAGLDDALVLLDEFVDALAGHVLPARNTCSYNAIQSAFLDRPAWREPRRSLVGGAIRSWPPERLRYVFESGDTGNRAGSSPAVQVEAVRFPFSPQPKPVVKGALYTSGAEVSTTLHGHLAPHLSGCACCADRVRFAPPAQLAC